MKIKLIVIDMTNLKLMFDKIKITIIRFDDLHIVLRIL